MKETAMENNEEGIEELSLDDVFHDNLSKEERARYDYIETELIPWIDSRECMEDDLEAILEWMVTVLSTYGRKPLRETFMKALTKVMNAYDKKALEIFLRIVKTHLEPMYHITNDGRTLGKISEKNFYLYLLMMLKVLELGSTQLMKWPTYWKTFVEVHCHLMDNLMDSSHFTMAKSIKSKFERILYYIPELIDGYMACLFAGNITEAHVAVIGCIINACKRLGESSRVPYFDKYKPSFMNAYIKLVLNSNQKLEVYHLDAFKPFIPLISKEEFIREILPSCERMLLRSPETFLLAFSSFTENVSFDMAPFFSANFVKPLITNIKSTNEHVREGSVDVLINASHCMENSENIMQIVFEFFEALSGRLPALEHKIAAASCLKALSCSHFSTQKFGVNSLLIFDKFTALIKKENHEASIAAFLYCFSSWLSRLESLLEGSEIVKFFHAGLLQEKYRKLYMKSMLPLLHQPQLNNFSSLVACLFEILDKANSNINMGYEGVLAVRCLLKFCQIPDYCSGLKLRAQDGLKILIEERFYLKFSDDEVLELVESIKEIICFREFLSLSDRFISALCNTLIWSTLSRSWKSARSIHEIIRLLVANDPDLFSHLLYEFSMRLRKSIAIAPQDTRSFNSLALSMISFSQGPTSKAIQERLCKSILIFHHCLVFAAPDQWNWSRALKKAASHKEFGFQIETFCEHYADRLVFTISSEYGFESTIQAELVAALQASKSLVILSPSRFISRILPLALGKLDSIILDEIPEEDILIYNTPEGTLCTDILKMTLDGKFPSQGKLERSSILHPDIKKKNQTLTSKEEERLIQAQIHKESVIRKNITSLVGRYHFAVQIIQSLIEGDSIAFEAFIPAVLKFTLHLKDYQIVRHDSFNLFLILARATHYRIQHISKDIAVALYRLCCPDVFSDTMPEDNLKKFILRIFREIETICQSKPLPAPSFAYVFPLLSIASQRYSEFSELVEVAFRIVSLHSIEGSSYLLPRLDMIKFFINGLKHDLKVKKSAQSGLIELSRAIDCSVTAMELDEFFHAIVEEDEMIRETILECLQSVPPIPSSLMGFSSRIFCFRYDECESNRKLADYIWEQNRFVLSSEYVEALLPLLIVPHYSVQKASAMALSTIVSHYPDKVNTALDHIYNTYYQLVAEPEVLYDEFDRPIHQEHIDLSQSRVGLAFFLRNITPYLSSEKIIACFKFLIKDALGDVSERVRQGMVESGLSLLNLHGQKNLDVLISMFEDYLVKSSSKDEKDDQIHEAVIIFLGDIARYLDSSDPRIPIIAYRLIESLKTPSESVQQAISECLPPLIKSMKEDVPKLIEQLLQRLLENEKFAERRGAAYGLAGVVKGRGIAALKECGVMSVLKESIEDKKNERKREGALFAFETLSLALGRLFEPYVIQILPLLLVCMGDNNRDVREAALCASKVIMSRLSGHCVKLVLPSLLTGIEDKQWRTKQGSAELLGSMAYCAPAQLSACLPSIVPRLIEVLTDSHVKVQEAGKQALREIGSVIKNPEVQILVPVLIEALSNPTPKSQDVALTGLLNTEFVHFIDAPSLALITPSLHRALKERSTDTKKKAAQIMANMCSLADLQDLIAYLSLLLPGLKLVLLDPIPEVRTIASKAMGTMVRKLGEHNFENLIPWLLQTMRSESSTVDRSGAAQGLSEVLSGIGVEKLDLLLPEIIESTNSPKAAIREGFLSILIYLPSAFRDLFQPYLTKVVPCILHGLADESEAVRDAALRAGQMIVRNYASSSVEILLPELQSGLFDDNWRIRQSSIQLLGDLLYCITGVSGKTTIDDDELETLGTEEGIRIVLSTLGTEKTRDILAALHILRADVNAIVRQSSLHVWKSIVSNTPRTMKEVLPNMMRHIVKCLASHSYDKQTVAGKTLGDLVRKLGERILPEILPTLQDGLDSEDADMRRGVCIGLSKVMASASRVHVAQYADSIIPAVRKGICDSDVDVREAAAQTFDVLYKHINDRAIDGILPMLIADLSFESERRQNTLEALKEIMSIRSSVVLPILIPQLLKIPMPSFNAEALRVLIPFAGSVLNMYLSKMLEILVGCFEDPKNLLTADVHRAIQTILLTINDDEGIRRLMEDITTFLKASGLRERRAGIYYTRVFCEETKLSFNSYFPNLFRQIMRCYVNSDPFIVDSGIFALGAIVRSIKKEDQPQYVGQLRRGLKSSLDEVGMGEDELVPGLSRVDGLAPLISMFLQGLINGSPEIRESSALGLQDIALHAEADKLKGYVIQITGPLIRVVGDRFPSQVKAAILQALNSFLSRVGSLMRPFLPQLQTTFIKAIQDPMPIVRNHANTALSKLITLQPRADPLLTELQSCVKSAPSLVKKNLFEALSSTLSVITVGISISVRNSILFSGLEGIQDEDEDVRIAAANTIAILAVNLEIDMQKNLLVQVISIDRTMPFIMHHGHILLLIAILRIQPALFSNHCLQNDLCNFIITSCSDTKPLIVQYSLRSIPYVILRHLFGNETYLDNLLDRLINSLVEKPVEIRLAAVKALKRIGRSEPELLSRYLNRIISQLLVCVKDRFIPIKLESERCLLYVLRSRQHISDDVVDISLLNQLDKLTAKSLSDYHRRVLSKLSLPELESDEEISISPSPDGILSL